MASKFPAVESDRIQVSSGGGRAPLFLHDGRRFLLLKEATAPGARAGSTRLLAVLGWERELQRLLPGTD